MPDSVAKILQKGLKRRHVIPSARETGKASALYQAPVVQTLDSAIHRIKIYPMDNAIGFPNTYPLDSDLSGG